MRLAFFKSMKTIHRYDLDKKGNHLTEQGNLLVEIFIQDKLSSQLCGTKWIKRAELARMFSEHKVIGSKNNRFVVEI